MPEPAAYKERAIQIAYAGHLMFVEGKPEQALAVSDRVLRVAPLDLSYRAARVTLLFYAHQYQRALDEVERVRELDPRAITMYVRAIPKGDTCLRSRARESDGRRVETLVADELERRRHLSSRDGLGLWRMLCRAKR